MHEAHHHSFFCACASSSLLCVECWWWPPLAVWNHLHLMHMFQAYIQTLLTFTTYFFTILRDTLHVLHTLRIICRGFTMVKGTSVSDEREISWGSWSHWLAGLHLYYQKEYSDKQNFIFLLMTTVLHFLVYVFLCGHNTTLTLTLL